MRLDLRLSVRGYSSYLLEKLISQIRFFLALSADPLLIWNYGSMGVLAALAGILFWFTFRHLDKEEEKLNELDEGRINVDAVLANEVAAGVGGGKGPVVGGLPKV